MKSAPDSGNQNGVNILFDKNSQLFILKKTNEKKTPKTKKKMHFWVAICYFCMGRLKKKKKQLLHFVEHSCELSNQVDLVMISVNFLFRRWKL